MTTFSDIENEAAFFSRVEKLLNLARHERTGEAEATSAAAMVQRLLQERGLTLAHVEARGGKSDDPNQGSRDKTTTDRRALYLWQQKLMAALARNNFCLHRLEEVWAEDRGKRRKSKRHMLIGRSINIRITLLAYDYLVESIRRMAGDEGFGHAEREKEHHTFLDGAIDRLKERLDEKREEREQEDRRRCDEARATRRHPSAAPSEPGTALVLADIYSSEEDFNRDLLSGLKPGTTAAARRAREAAAVAAELAAAKRDQLREELEKSGVPWPKSHYMASGYDAATAQELHDEYIKESAKESKRQDRRQSNGSGRRYRESASDRARNERENSSAYRAGKRAGNAVNLNQQIENARKVIK